MVEVTRKLTLGTLEQAQNLLQHDLGCQQFNTSLLNASMAPCVNGWLRSPANVGMRLIALKRWKQGMYCDWMHATISASRITN